MEESSDEKQMVPLISTDNSSIGSNMNPFENIPPEIVASIFSSLSTEDKSICRLTNKTWKDILESIFLKFSFDLRNTNLKWLPQLTVNIYKLNVGDLYFVRGLAGNNPLASVLDVNFAPDHEFDDITLHTILTKLDNVETISFEPTFFAAIRFYHKELQFNQIRLETLTKLVLIIGSYNTAQAFLAIFSLITPNLHEIEAFRIFPCSCCGPYYGRDVVRGFLEFIARNKSSLKVLKASNSLVHSSCFIPLSPSEQNSDSRNEEILKDLSEVKLTCLHLKHYPAITAPPWKLPAKLINSQTCLEEILTDLQPPMASINFSQLFSQNSSTLRVIHIKHSRSRRERFAQQFDCNWLVGMKGVVDFGVLTYKEVRDLDKLPGTIETLSWSAPLTRAELLELGANLPKLRVLALREVFNGSGPNENYGMEVQNGINLQTFQQILGRFKKLDTLMASERDFCIQEVNLVRNYCEGTDGLEWIETTHRDFMACHYIERSFIIKIKRN